MFHNVPRQFFTDWHFILQTLQQQNIFCILDFACVKPARFIFRRGIPDQMIFVFKTVGQDQIAFIKVLPIYASTNILIYHNLFKPSSAIALPSCLQSFTIIFKALMNILGC